MNPEKDIRICKKKTLESVKRVEGNMKLSTWETVSLVEKNAKKCFVRDTTHWTVQ